MATTTSSDYSQAALDRRLLAAANTLRGPVDPADFKAYVFPLLFFKRISDTWDWERARALDAFDGNAELAAHPDNYRFVLPPGCRWDDALALHENVGAGLQQILDRIQEANPDTLAGIFGDVQWANKEKLPEASLTNLLDVLSGLQLNPAAVSHDLLGNAYEYLLKNFADESGKKAGEFFTPRSVVRLLSEILDPKEEESAHDPTCGSGGMLVEMVNHVRENGGDPRTLKLSGQEISLTTAAIARMNLFIHDIEDFRILRGDTLREPRFRDAHGGLQRFDLVIANPPFSLTPGVTRRGQTIRSSDPAGDSRPPDPPILHSSSTCSPSWTRHAAALPSSCPRVCSREAPRSRFAATSCKAVCSKRSSDCPRTSSTTPIFPPASSSAVPPKRPTGTPFSSLTGPAASRKMALATVCDRRTSRRSLPHTAAVRTPRTGPCAHRGSPGTPSTSTTGTSTSVCTSKVSPPRQRTARRRSRITSLPAMRFARPRRVSRTACARWASLGEHRELTPLAALAAPISVRAGEGAYEVLSVTKHRGIIRADDYFNRPVASRDLARYKVVEPGQFAYSTIHIDEGAIARNKLGFAGVVSPMYQVFEAQRPDLVLPEFLDYLLRAPALLAIYRAVLAAPSAAAAASPSTPSDASRSHCPRVGNSGASSM